MPGCLLGTISGDLSLLNLPGNEEGQQFEGEGRLAYCQILLITRCLLALSSEGISAFTTDVLAKCCVPTWLELHHIHRLGIDMALQDSTEPTQMDRPWATLLNFIPNTIP